MAKDKKKKEKVKKERPPKSGPGLFSRISLPLLLIPILILAGASFFALGLLKQKAASKAKLSAIDNRIAQKIDELPPPTFKKPPPTLRPRMSTTDIQPTMAGEPDGAPSAAPPPSTTAAVPPSPAPNPMAQAAMPQSGVETGALPVKAEAVLPGLAQAQGQPTPLAAGTTAVSPPGPAPEPEKAGPIKPMWQTVDQQWDDVTVQPAEPGGAGETSAAWRSINIGQSDDISNQVAESPIMGAALTPPKQGEPEKTPEKLAPPKASSAKKARPSARSSRKIVRRKKQSRVPTVAIINETGVPQAAQVYRDVLLAFSSSVGIRVGPIQEAPPKTGATTIFYGAGMRAKAQALSRRIPGRKTLAPLGNKAEHDILLVVRSR